MSNYQTIKFQLWAHTIERKQGSTLGYFMRRSHWSVQNTQKRVRQKWEEKERSNIMVRNHD